MTNIRPGEGKPGAAGAAGERAGIEDAGAPHSSGCDGQAAACPGGGPGQRPAADPDGRTRRPGCGQPGGEVGGERGQVGAGPRGERLARPQVELVFGQHARHERGLERTDHLFAVGVRRRK
jgi:hypothetical protein